MTEVISWCSGYSSSWYSTGGSWSDYDSYSGNAGRATSGLYYTTIVKFYAPIFTGTAFYVTVALPFKKGAGANTSTTLRWALAVGDNNKNNYINTYAAVSDPNQVASGVITISGLSSTSLTHILPIPIPAWYTMPSGQVFCLFLWAGSSADFSQANLITSEVGATVAFNGNVVKVCENGSWNNYQAYVCNGTGWDGYKPMIHNGSSWVEHG